jgi:hypothetical protein
MAQAQQVSPPPVESHDMPWEREFGPVEFARHFREYVRLIGGLQDRAVEASRRRGDFWTPDELRQLFRR